MSDVITRSAGAAVRKRRCRSNDFSARKQQRFFDALALTCNVRRAAEHAGVSANTAYVWRRREVSFAARWQEAVASACDRLELLVLEHGGAGMPLEPGDGDRAIAEGADASFDFNRAVSALKLFRGQREGQVLASAGSQRRVATRDELVAALTKALAAVKRGQEKAEAAR